MKFPYKTLDKMEQTSQEIKEIALRMKASAERNDRLKEACRQLLHYRKRNTLNFQLEKADDYFRKIQQILDEE